MCVCVCGLEGIFATAVLASVRHTRVSNFVHSQNSNGGEDTIFFCKDACQRIMLQYVAKTAIRSAY